MYPERHALRFAIYGGALYALGSKGTGRKVAALAGAGAYAWKPLRRAMRTFADPPERVRAGAAIPALMAFARRGEAGRVRGGPVGPSPAWADGPGTTTFGLIVSGVMANKKRKSTASKQRAKARQQQRATAALQGGQEPRGVANEARPQAVRRPGDRLPRAPKRRSSRRRTPWLMVGAVVAVVGFFVVMFVMKNDNTERGNASGGSIDKVLTVPASTLEAVGVPAQPSNVNALPAGTPAVEQDGKPVFLYVGAEYCPFCAVERWPVVVALSRFGTFSNLDSTTSAPAPETLPNTPTVTFHGATYTSDYLVFSSVETETRTFTPLGTPTDFQQQLFDTYNVDAITGSSGGIPFVLSGNRYAWAGSQYDPAVLDGKDFDQIANALANPNTEISKAIGGAANYITAMICQLTDGQPQDVCSSAVIQQAQAALPTA